VYESGEGSEKGWGKKMARKREGKVGRKKGQRVKRSGSLKEMGRDKEGKLKNNYEEMRIGLGSWNRSGNVSGDRSVRG
jgi:hypothetical protein